VRVEADDFAVRKGRALQRRAQRLGHFRELEVPSLAVAAEQRQGMAVERRLADPVGVVERAGGERGRQAPRVGRQGRTPAVGGAAGRRGDGGGHAVLRGRCAAPQKGASGVPPRADGAHAARQLPS
jgi:hypothetical protein